MVSKSKKILKGIGDFLGIFLMVLVILFFVTQVVVGFLVGFGLLLAQHF